MAPKYKLTYFPVEAIAGPIRFLLKYGGIDFEDYRFKVEDWPKIMPTTPFGQAPILEVDGKVAHQSLAICRYLAKQVKLTGKNDWEDLEIDSIVDTIYEVRVKYSQYHHEKDEEKKASLKELIIKQTLPFYLDRLDAIAKENNGHLALGRLTWADVYFAAMVDYFSDMIQSNVIADYPNLQKVRNTVLAIPAIKDWVETRPKS